MRQFMARLAFVVAACTVLLTETSAQTAEQLELLDALPTSQREAILREIRQQERPGERTLEDSGIGAEQYLNIPEPESESEDDGIPRLSANSTIVIEFSLPEEQITQFSPENGVQVGEFRQRLQVGNPYRLDEEGFLYLPGVEAIALAGLNVDEAMVRLEAEPALTSFQ